MSIVYWNIAKIVYNVSKVGKIMQKEGRADERV